jgi:hypothetical protein
VLRRWISCGFAGHGAYALCAVSAASRLSQSVRLQMQRRETLHPDRLGTNEQNQHEQCKARRTGLRSRSANIPTSWPWESPLLHYFPVYVSHGIANIKGTFASFARISGGVEWLALMHMHMRGASGSGMSSCGNVPSIDGGFSLQRRSVLIF